eukprot:scpid109816/ scgid8726/ 
MHTAILVCTLLLTCMSCTVLQSCALQKELRGPTIMTIASSSSQHSSSAPFGNSWSDPSSKCSCMHPILLVLVLVLVAILWGYHVIETALLRGVMFYAIKAMLSRCSVRTTPLSS